MPEIRPGSVVSGRFRVLAVLGKGAMGVVYLAEQLDLDGGKLREVALKTVNLDQFADPELAAQIPQRFLREIRIAARLSSPNTVVVHDSGRTEDGQLYFSMELVRGETLRDLLRREKRLSPERAVGIACQICDALAEAHSGAQAIVHRDLKPANIFMQQREGRDWVKVADFGIAKILGADTSGLTATGLTPGTPLYMSPEQWRGDKELDARSDLYALGVILHEMLSGAPPFTGEPHVLMYRHLHEQPPDLPDDVPAGLRKLVRVLMEKDPAARPSNASAVRRALEEAVKGEPPERAVSTAFGRAPTEILAPKAASQPTLVIPAPHAEALSPPSVLPPTSSATLGREAPSRVLSVGIAIGAALLALVGGVYYVATVGAPVQVAAAPTPAPAITPAPTAPPAVVAPLPTPAILALPTSQPAADAEENLDRLKAPASAPSPLLAARAGVVNKGTELRERPGADARLLGTFARRTNVDVIETQGNWSRVLAPVVGGSSAEGWVLSSAIIPAAVAAPRGEHGPDNILLRVLAGMTAERPLTPFTHKKHWSDYSVKCEECHHPVKAKGGAVPATKTCSDAGCHQADQCNGQAVRAKNKACPFFSDAYHFNCVECHRAQSGPTKCNECHSG